MIHGPTPMVHSAVSRNDAGRNDSAHHDSDRSQRTTGSSYQRPKTFGETSGTKQAHNSTAIEGNTLVLREVEILLAEGRAVANKQLAEYMEVRGYADAAEWVYQQWLSPGDWSTGELVTLTRSGTSTPGAVQSPRLRETLKCDNLRRRIRNRRDLGRAKSVAVD